MKRIPLYLILMLAVFWTGCSKDSSVVDSEMPIDDIESSEVAPARTEYNPTVMTTVAEAREATPPESLPEEAVSPPEVSDEEAAQRQAEVEAASKTGSYYYSFPGSSPCYACWYWPASIGDVGVSSAIPWFDWYGGYSRVGNGWMTLYPNGEVTAMRFRGYFYAGVWIEAYDDNGAFVGNKYISGRYGWFDYTQYWSRPVAVIRIYNYYYGVDYYNYWHSMWLNYVETNAAPVANAGADQSVVVGNGTTLDGSGSSDPDGDVLTYQWKEGGSVIGNSATASIAPFTATGSHTYTLTVTDPDGASSTDQVTVVVTNTAPDANAGADQTVFAGQVVGLDGSASSDADGHALSFAWSSGSSSASATVGPFNPGSYTFTLSVDDGYGGTDSDDVTITVTAIPVAFDIKPGDSKNQVNSKSKGVIPTAILGSADFDVSEIDVASLAFGPGGAGESHGSGHVEDVNGDGYDDLVLHFDTQGSGLSKGDTSATLTGTTTGGWAFEGADSVSVK